MKKIFLLSLLLCAQNLLSASLPDFGAVGTFSLLDENGKTFTEKDLEGKIWLVDFVFTRCTGPCPLLSRRMSELARMLPKKISFLTVTVDPDFDSPQVLKAYSASLNADPARWRFLTGPRKEVYRLIREGFLSPVETVSNAAAGEGFIHTQNLVLVDADGRIRQLYDGTNADDIEKIPGDLDLLSSWLSRIPTVNASLNLAAAFFLAAGYFFIRRKRVLEHKISMGIAFAVSSLFLAGYLYYHSKVGSVPFQGEGPVRSLYFAVLISHSILAVLVVPLVLHTLLRAFRGDFEAHKKIARWTFPVWMYVSVTGVAVYYMLYRL